MDEEGKYWLVLPFLWFVDSSFLFAVGLHCIPLPHQMWPNWPDHPPLTLPPAGTSCQHPLHQSGRRISQISRLPLYSTNTIIIFSYSEARQKIFWFLWWSYRNWTKLNGTCFDIFTFRREPGSLACFLLLCILCLIWDMMLMISLQS